MYDYYQEIGNKSRHESQSKQAKNAGDSFAEMFEFELNINQKLTPAQKAMIERDALLEKDPATLRPSEQLFAMFARVDGVRTAELLAICATMARKDGSTAFSDVR